MSYWHTSHNGTSHGISDFALYNQRLRSHEAHCHGGNTGSIWGYGCNTGYTMCGGTGFWGSLKMGLGYGLANGLTNLIFAGASRLFGGLFGGGLGMGGLFGGLGMGGGMFGLGNTGFWGLNGSNWLGGADRGNTAGGAGGARTVEKENADQAKLNEIDNKSNTILLTKMKNLPTDREGLTALQTEIDALLKELDEYKKEDDINTTADDNQIKQIEARLADCKTTVDTKIAALPPVEGEDEVEEEDPVEGEDNNITINGQTKKVEDIVIDDIDDITAENYDDLDEDTQKAILEKISEIIGDVAPEVKKGLATNENLPSAIRAEIKKSYYQEGMTNVTQEEFTEDSLRNLIAVIDTSEIADFENIEVEATKTGANNQIEEFKITSTTGTEVTYARVTVRDGELIFHGAKTDQEYVVQKDADGNYKLMQYDYHKGHGTPDVSSNS